MEIIATTKEGFLMSATKDEVNAILNSVYGKAPDNIEVGVKVPGLNYALTLNKLKALKDNYYFKEILVKASKFNQELESLTKVVNAIGDGVIE